MAENKNLKRRAGGFTAVGCAFVVLAIVSEGSLKWPLLVIGLVFFVLALVTTQKGKQSKTE